MNRVDTDRLPLVVSIGEPAGIGPDIALHSWEANKTRGHHALPNHILLADPDHLQNRADLLGINVKIELVDIEASPLPSAAGNCLRVHRLKNSLCGMPGKPKAQDAAGIVESITAGVRLIQLGDARGLVTLPINKKSLYDAGFSHPGHTEFLGAIASEWPDQITPVKPVMMLAGPDLRAIPVTIHIPLKEVPEALTSDNIIDTVTISHRDLKSRFGIEKPRIAVSGLNPHAGESGSMGHEDKEIIAPAISQLQQRGIDCFGPLPADTMFHPAARARYDAAVCMYHDQALIPAKALAFDESVNVTLGLPFVRTSPDHGTAYDIAGTGTANPSSYIAALRMADEMSKR